MSQLLLSLLVCKQKLMPGLLVCGRASLCVCVSVCLCVCLFACLCLSDACVPGERRNKWLKILVAALTMLI